MKFRISIEAALTVLEKNLAEHITELKESTGIWTEKVIEELKKLRDAVDRKGLEASHDGLNALFYQRPTDNRKEYSKFIGALKVARDSGETHIELSEDNYDAMFNDNWDWRVRSKVINSTYKR